MTTGEFGYRFIADEPRDAGHQMSENRVHRLCSERGIFSAHSVKRPTRSQPGPPVHDDLVGREVTATAPNHLWLADITEHPNGEGKVYPPAVKDVFSNRIVGYSIDSRMKARLAGAALHGAVSRRGGVEGCVVHSGRGSQFRSRKIIHALHDAGLVGSMGRVGAAGDNAAMESFFALLQKNVLDRHRWATP